MKVMLAKWMKKYPGRIKSIFTALQQVAPSHLLDTKLYDFEHFTASCTQKVLWEDKEIEHHTSIINILAPKSN